MNRVLIGIRALVTAVFLVVIAYAGGAQGSDGDRLILGRSNYASTATGLYNDAGSALEIAGAPAIQAYGRDASMPTLMARESGSNTDISTNAGAAVLGWTNADEGGIGILAASGPHDGVALGVRGRAVFERSGSVRIAYPATSATVTAPLGQAETWLRPGYGAKGPEALVIATLQTHMHGVFVSAAVTDVAHGSFTIYLNKAPGTVAQPRSVRVAWFIVN